MPSQSFTVTWPAGKSTKLLAAWRRHYGPKTGREGDPNDPPVEYTADEIRGLIGQELRNKFMNVYERNEKALRDETALEAIDPTVVDTDV